MSAPFVAGGVDPGRSGVWQHPVPAGNTDPGYNKPREIEVHIEELVLHGVEPRDRWTIGDALERELRGLLAEKGIPPAWLASPERIDAGRLPAISVAKAAATGAGIANAIHRGGAK